MGGERERAIVHVTVLLIADGYREVDLNLL